MNQNDDSLGLRRGISRRDFIGGAALALSGSLSSCSWVQTSSPRVPNVDPMSDAPYPPDRVGLRGSHPGSFEIAHQLVRGKRWSDAQDTEEYYDLVIVGGGLSGLASAWFYHESNPTARILILDNHDDFGGHAKRNEFWHKDRMFVSHGGTINIQDFTAYSEPAQHLIRRLGIEPERYHEFNNPKIHDNLGLKRSIFLDKETFGRDQLLVNPGHPSWREFLARTPLTVQAQDDIARLHESNVDYMSGMTQEQKRHRLRQISYQQFLTEYAGVHPDSLAILQKNGYWAIGNDALPAWTATADGEPGTGGLGFTSTPHSGVYFRFPDGNASVARLLVRSLIPTVAPGSGMEDIVTARFDYNQLDQPNSTIRIRLQSTVVNVSHEGDKDSADTVNITYIENGQAKRVRAGQTILACYHGIIPHLCEELPVKQKAALSQSLKAPLVYTSVLLRNWRAFAKLGINRVDCPGSYFGRISLTPPTSIGEYRTASSPREPNILHLYRMPLAPGHSAADQWRLGRQELYTTTFETFERNLREQLHRILSPGGFDAARDIEAITVNRWPHGYAYGQNPQTGEIAYLLNEFPDTDAPWLTGRKSFGRIAIANSDAGANAMTEEAIGQAYRAVQELAE